MSAHPPAPGPRTVAEKPPDDRSSRERSHLRDHEALLREVQLLREQNARLLTERALLAEAAPGAATRLQAVDGSGSRRATQPEFEALFHALFSAFPVGVYRTDAAGWITHTDEALQQIFDLQASAFAHHGWLSRVHPDDVERVRREWVVRGADPTARTLEFRLLNPRSGTVHLLARNTPLRDLDGRISGQIGFAQDVSSMRRLEAENRVQDELNRQIIASSPDCTLVLDLDGRVLQMNAQGYLLLEADPSQPVTGSAWPTWWPEQGAQLAQQALEQARKGERSRFTAPCPTFQGRLRWWDTMVSAISDADGRPAMLLAVSRDISEQQQRQRQQAQQQEIHRLNETLETRERQRTEALADPALRESQRFLQTVTDHVPGQIAYVDRRLCLAFSNAAYQRMFGVDMERSQGRPIRDCLPDVEWDHIGPRLEVALSGQAQTFESERQTAQGEPLVVRTTLQPDWHGGQVQGVFVQTIDITEHKRVEQRVNQLNDELEQRIQDRSQELLESEQRFRLMVDNLRDYCIFFLDASGHISDWTDSAQRLEGYAPTEILGEHFACLFHGKDPDAARQSADNMLRLAASRGQHELSGWHTRKDGSNYFAHSLLIALRDDDGDLQGFAKINRDMTDAKRLDDLLRNINDELENRVAERTEQLLAANKDLESFSYSVSHDLRSPLRHISSFVSLLEEHLGQRDDDVTQRYLSTISNSARHMSQLIDGLLAFSRLGRAAVNLIEVNFSQLVEAVVSQLSHDVGERKVEWIIPEDLPVVQGDALLLREVWANLLGNAFKYSRPRDVSRIEIRWWSDPAVGYIFEVRDNGVGFDTNYAQKLFGVFQRLHRASEFEGTGIGLALTRRILERHGGSIWADSRQGEGSVFSFSLPFEGQSPSDSQLDASPSVLEP